MLRITSQNRVLIGALFFVYFILVIQPWELFFLNDDFIHIPLSTKTIWVHFQFFRPVPNLVTSLEIRLFGTDPLGYHITSILLHIITTILVIKLFRALSTTYGHAEKYRNTDFIAGCLFFLYPFHSEPVMWVIGRIAILATLFVVISLLLFVRRSRGRLFYFLSLCSFAIALLTYEISWIVPVTVTIFAVFDHYRKEKQFHKSIVALAPYWILFGMLLVVRFSMLQGVMTRYEVTGRDISPIALAGKWLRLFARTVVPPSESTKTFMIIFACAVIVQSTLSRAGLFIFGFGTMLVVLASLMDKATRRRLAILAGITCIGILGLAMTLDTIIKRFTDYGTQESKITRDHLNIASRKMLYEYPLGIGWNNFAEVINPPWWYGDHIDEYHRQAGNTVDKTYKKGVVESLWYLHLAETGYQGLITYLIIIALFLFWNVQNIFYYRRRYLGAVSIGLFVGSLMNYLQSFLERVLTQPRNVMLWLILLAITARITVWRTSERRRRNREWRERIERIPVQRQLAYQNASKEEVAA